MKKVISYSLLVLCLVALAVGIEQYYRMFVSNITANDNEQHLLYIYPGSSLDSVFNAICETHDVASPWNLRFHSRLLKFSHPKPGCYILNPKEGDIALIRRLRGGEQTPVEVTFNRIRTRSQLAKRLSEQLLLDSAEVSARLESNDYMSQFGLQKETAVCLFIPNTYQLYWTISADALFARMQTEYNHFWTPERDKKAKQLGLTRVAVATVASIAEEETNKDFEYPIIAGLYINRLRQGMPLQACPTIKFAWQDFSLRRILNKHLDIDSPYNTYKNKGLPPGPIRIPRAATMDAVLNYTPSTYLFMCASADFNGTHHFSSTYAEHSRYAREYQAELNRRNIK
ncbi:MAG: endolytic transglycosylase MltG [Paludibacteraceae bacterium]|nr:endolytic transglycosylase MltG [Paludibacteraceae bacterium]